MRYTFGRTQTAAARLETIAEFFNPLAMEFIAEFINEPVNTGLDLGCGPGFTTEMLRQTLCGAKVSGLDNSENFLKLAREKFPKCNFLQHDVTRRPFPLQPNVMYERFLLPHLKNAVNLVNAWLGELLPGGFLFIDELEAIDTNVPVFQQYLAINAGLVRSQDANLFVGKILAAGAYTAKVLYNEPIRLPVCNSLAAKWFYPNTVTIWEKEKFILDTVPAEQRKQISSDLAKIQESNDGKRDIVWTMRRMVLHKD
ncbi:MAG: methyltransferase domain-containing protein [Phycisphaerae bacterium]